MDQSVVAVTGMSCGHCADAVRAEITRIPGVSHVDVDVESGQVKIAAAARPGGSQSGGRGRRLRGGGLGSTPAGPAAARAVTP